MRYLGISPDSQPVSNGKRIASNPDWKTYREEEEEAIVMEEIINGGSGSFSRFRSPASKKDSHHSSNNGTESSNKTQEDVLLQWGHRKRSRCSRGVVVSPTNDDSSSSLDIQLLLPNKVPRRSSTHGQSNAINTNGILDPSLPSSSNVALKGPKNKHSSRIASSSASLVRRGSDEQSGGGGGGVNRAVPSRSRVAVKKSPSRDKKTTPLSPGQSTATTKADTLVHLKGHPEAMSVDSKGTINEANNGIPTSKAGGGGEKVNGAVEVHEWPRIYIALSRKEKEEDFMAMKGSKLPHRPKKRPKAIGKMLQYCYPGMWLADLTRGRYEVREKKSSRKQKRRGLKGMENVESDSE